jgi:hypothetical protein
MGSVLKGFDGRLDRWIAMAEARGLGQAYGATTD